MQRKRLGAFHEDDFVQRGEGLQRRVRAQPADAGEIAVGRVEGLQHRVGDGTKTECVNRATISVRAGFFVPNFRAVTGGRLENESRARAA